MACSQEEDANETFLITSQVLHKCLTDRCEQLRAVLSRGAQWTPAFEQSALDFSSICQEILELSNLISEETDTDEETRREIYQASNVLTAELRRFQNCIHQLRHNPTPEERGRNWHALGDIVSGIVARLNALFALIFIKLKP